ncbi:MAG: hypothetical protein JNG88_14980 [Phycisphaerales bacterium]|nr:hypothetical protein [Phycisphaerales bacterium]
MSNWKENFQNLVWQSGTLYTVRMQPREDEYGPRFVAHWYKIDVSTWPAEPFPFSPFPTIIDDGIVDPGRVFASDDSGDNPACDRTAHAIFPYVMPTSAGELALFFTRMHRYGYADLCLTGRRLTDPPGVMGAPIVPFVAGSAAVDIAPRWGDYEGIARDPNSGETIWYTGETGRCGPVVSPCTTCVSGPYCAGTGTLLGQLQSYYHTAIGSYAIRLKQ